MLNSGRCPNIPILESHPQPGNLLPFPGLRDASIVDENIDRAEVRFDLRDHSLHINSKGHIGLHLERFPAEPRDVLVDGLGGVRSLAIVDCDMSASLSERHGNPGCPDAPTDTSLPTAAPFCVVHWSRHATNVLPGAKACQSLR